MSIELILILCLLPLNFSFTVPIDDSSIAIDCLSHFGEFRGISDIKMICNGINMTVDTQYRLTKRDYEWHRIKQVEITNSIVPRVYKKTFSLQHNLQDLTIYNSGLTEIHYDDFIKFNRLQQLNFTNNQITNVAANAFIHNPQLLGLILKKNKLQSIKNLTTYQLQTFDVSYNLITIIRDNDFHESFYAGEINLSHNQIYEIEEKAFLHFTNITKIDLSSNFLQKLPSNFDFIIIHSLDISHNFLHNISCNNVTTDLDVSYNFIEKLCDVADSLVNLQYSFNDLVHISENSFKGLSELKYLDLSINDIMSIDSKSFCNLGELRQLNLSLNYLEGDVLSEVNFENMTQLQILDLSHNNINNILYGAFSDQKSLKFLDVSYNDLTSINSLLSFHSLKVLNISDNPLEKIQPQKIVSHLKNLQNIVLNFDEIACEELVSNLLVFREHGVKVQIGPASYNSNIHGHHCNPDKDLYFIDPVTQNYKKMIYLTDYISQFSILVVVILISLVLLITFKLFDIYKIAHENINDDKIIDVQSSTNLLSDMEVNNDA